MRRCALRLASPALQGKVAVITGGTSGIGAATAHRLAAQQCRLVLAGRSEAKGAAVAEALRAKGAEALFVPTDVAIESDVQRLMETAVGQFGGIDLLFSNAGTEASGFPNKAFHKYVREYTQTIQTNLLGALWTFSYALPHLMERGGVVVNNSSNASANGRIGANVSAYAASKAALDSLTRSWAVLYRKQNVRVYAVNPFFVATPMVGDHVNALAKAFNPSGKAATPDDVAQVVEAMFAGTTTYQSGDCVLVDAGPTTANIQVLYNLTTVMDMKNLGELNATVLRPALKPVL